MHFVMMCLLYVWLDLAFIHTKTISFVFSFWKANLDILNALPTNEFIVDPFHSECFPVSPVSMETTQSLGVIQHNLFFGLNIK